MEAQTKQLIVTNRMVMAIALPMTLAFVTVPLLGIVDTTIVGQFGDAVLIGGLAVGAIIFDIVFSMFNFLRTGTTGFVSQAFGRDDEKEQQAIFWRSILMSVGFGLALWPLSPLIISVGLWFISPSEPVIEAAKIYMAIRFIGAPFSLINYSVLGMLLGQNRAVANLILQTTINALNIALSITLGLLLKWNIAGVAWATIISEALVATGALLWIWRGFDRSQSPSKDYILNRVAFLKLAAVNFDIMIRSLALMAVFFLFTRLGSNLGTVTLAANAILLNFFMVSAYFLDGLAAAAEQLAGRAVGAGSKSALWQTLRKTSGFGFALSLVAAVLFLVFGGQVIDFMTTAEDVRAVARSYLIWMALTPIAGVLAFQMDGIFIGATWSADMRNMMLVSLVVFVALAFALPIIIGNHGLWIALNAWLFARGFSLLAMVPKRAALIA